MHWVNSFLFNRSDNECVNALLTEDRLLFVVDLGDANVNHNVMVIKLTLNSTNNVKFKYAHTTCKHSKRCNNKTRKEHVKELHLTNNVSRQVHNEVKQRLTPNVYWDFFWTGRIVREMILGMEKVSVKCKYIGAFFNTSTLNV